MPQRAARVVNLFQMEIAISEGILEIKLRPLEQLAAFKLDGEIAVPLDAIERVSTERPPTEWLSLRIPGTHLPGVLKAGTYYTRQGPEFWFAVGGRGFLVIELRDQRYKRIVLTPEDNQAWAEMIRSARVTEIN